MDTDQGFLINIYKEIPSNFSTMKKSVLRIIKIVLLVYVSICVLLYFLQEKIIFLPEKLARDYRFNFNNEFAEVNIKTRDHISLNSLLFKSDSSRGLIFYLHGNAGSLRGWGKVAGAYTDMNYDVFMPDYRGYGKSDGKISSETQFFQDLQTAYDSMKLRYRESNIIVLGYSIGTGPACKIASGNHPKLLVLQAPYYSLTDMMRHNYPLVPTFLLKYKFETYKFIQACKMPIVIFHGDEDKVIHYNSSVRLREFLKASDTLITLKGQKHNGITDNQEYITEMKRIMKQ
jgi:alpha-beta hydrolase superfamily lysophospholipase